MSNITAQIEQRLRAALTPQSLDIMGDGVDDSGGHFAVRVVSSAFAGKTLIQRHRLIYAALADLMRNDIHALSITKAQTPDEV